MEAGASMGDAFKTGIVCGVNELSRSGATVVGISMPAPDPDLVEVLAGNRRQRWRKDLDGDGQHRESGLLVPTADPSSRVPSSKT
jgi:hypothetical protein